MIGDWLVIMNSGQVVDNFFPLVSKGSGQNHLSLKSVHCLVSNVSGHSVWWTVGGVRSTTTPTQSHLGHLVFVQCPP